MILFPYIEPYLSCLRREYWENSFIPKRKSVIQITHPIMTYSGIIFQRFEWWLWTFRKLFIHHSQCTTVVNERPEKVHLRSVSNLANNDSHSKQKVALKRTLLIFVSCFKEETMFNNFNVTMLLKINEYT